MDALLEGRDGAPEPVVAASPRAPVKAAAGAKPGVAAAAAAPAAEATPRSPVPATMLAPLLRVVAGGKTSTIPGRVADGAVLGTLVGPDGGPLPVGDATVAVSVDGGSTFTAPVAFKIAKS